MNALHVCVRFAATLLLAACATAQAAGFDDFYKAPSQACLAQSEALGALVEARNRDTERADAKANFSAAWNSPRPLPAGLIDEAYDFRALNDRAFVRAELWRCKAREAGIEPAPLSALADDIGACWTYSLSNACWANLRRKIIGAPADYVEPESKPAPSSRPAALPLRATSALFSVKGHVALGKITMSEIPTRLYVQVALRGLAPNVPVVLRVGDRGDCRDPALLPPVPAREGNAASSTTLQADAHGVLDGVIPLADGQRLSAGPRSIADLPLGLYMTRDYGSAVIACGRVELLAPITDQAPVLVRMTPAAKPSFASRDDARTCMNSEDRIVTFDQRSDSDRAAVQSAPDAAARAELLGVQASHDAEFQDALHEHSKRCGQLRVDPADRAAILKERQTAHAEP